MDISKLPTDSLVQLHWRLYEAVEVEGSASPEDMRLYFKSRYELETRGWRILPDAPFYERSDALFVIFRFIHSLNYDRIIWEKTLSIH